MPLINCEITSQLTWSANCVIINLTGVGTFKVKNTPFYAPVLTLPTQISIKLLQHLNSSFKRTISQNKYLINDPVQTQNRDLDYLVSPNFQRVNRLSVLSFENEEGRKSHAAYYLPKVEIKDYNVKIHCVKNVRIRSFSEPSGRENTDQRNTEHGHFLHSD